MAAIFPLPCSYIVSKEVALLFGRVSSFGVLDKGVPSGIWHRGSMGKKIVLESLRHCVHWLGLSQRGMCWSCTAGHLARRVHSHHQHQKLKWFIFYWIMYITTDQHYKLYGNQWGLFTAKAWLAWKLAILVLPFPPPIENFWIQPKSFQILSLLTCRWL